MTETTSTDRARAAAGLPTSDSPPPGRELSVRDRKIAERSRVIEAMAPHFQKAMPVGLEAQQLVRDAITATRNVPELINATQDSFLGALMTAAQLGLRPNVPALGHGWVLPFRNNKRGVTEAQWILGYQGMIELAQRTGMIASIVAHTIYANEKHEIEWGIHEKLVHVPIFEIEKRGKPILHYAVARFTHTDIPAWHIMGEDEIEKIRLGSKSASSQFSPWNTHREEMARKSAVIRLFKFLPKTTLLAQAIAADESVRTDLDVGALDANSAAATVTVPTDPKPPEDIEDAQVVPDEPTEAEAPQDSPEAAATAPASPEPTGDPSELPSLLERQPGVATQVRRAYIATLSERFAGRLDLGMLVANVTGHHLPADGPDLAIEEIFARFETTELREAITVATEDAGSDG